MYSNLDCTNSDGSMTYTDQHTEIVTEMRNSMAVTQHMPHLPHWYLHAVQLECRSPIHVLVLQYLQSLKGTNLCLSLCLSWRFHGSRLCLELVQLLTSLLSQLHPGKSEDRAFRKVRGPATHYWQQQGSYLLDDSGKNRLLLQSTCTIVLAGKRQIHKT